MVAVGVEWYFQTREHLARWKREGSERLVAWAVKVSGEEHRGQKARQCKGPGVRPCVVSLEASKTLCSEPGAGVEGAWKAAQNIEGTCSRADPGKDPVPPHRAPHGF